MKAYRLFEWGEPPRLVEIPVPEPGPGEVRIRVAGNGICQSDLHVIHEWKACPPHYDIELPWTLGHEVGGWVDRLGPGVGGFEPGEPVLVTIAGCGRCRYCAAGWNNYCLDKGPQVGIGLDGGLAEYTVAPAAALVPISMDPADAAPLTDAGLSAYHALKRVLPLLTGGSRVAVIGVGGLGHMAVQILARTTPAHITAFARSESSRSHALELGADEALPSEKESVAPLSFDAVLDFVGAAATMELAAHMIKPLGHIVVAGRGKGSFAFHPLSQPYGTFISTTFGGSKGELMELIGMMEKGLIKPRITRFRLDDVEEALEKLARGEIRGRAVVVPG
jgi:propanol-preferring alcohol dehydrogenase